MQLAAAPTEMKKMKGLFYYNIKQSKMGIYEDLHLAIKLTKEEITNNFGEDESKYHTFEFEDELYLDLKLLYSRRDRTMDNGKIVFECDRDVEYILNNNSDTVKKYLLENPDKIDDYWKEDEEGKEKMKQKLIGRFDFSKKEGKEICLFYSIWDTYDNWEVAYKKLGVLKP